MSHPITTDRQDELLTEVDEHNQVIGPIERGLAHRSPDRIYRNIFVLVFDQEGRVLVQKRSPTKDLYPGCWDLSVGGHVTWGKTYGQAARDELEEELGISSAEDELGYVGEVVVRLPQSQEFFHVFEYTLKPTDEVLIEHEEISEINWMSVEDIGKSMEKQTLDWYGRPEQVINALY